MKQMNFGRNVAIHPANYFAPRNEKEVLELLNRFKGHTIRCIGRLHSWSRILESPDVLLDLRQLNAVQPVEEGPIKSVVVGASCQISRLLAELQRQKNWTLPSVGFITEQTVAGAIATGTHGSGRHSLSHYVLSIRIAHYDPQTGSAIISEITSGEALQAARCSLGCLGVILSVRMQCREMYSVEEQFREYHQLADILDAEKMFPLQQFYLVPWRWSYFAQHRRETSAAHSPWLVAYQWYRFVVFDVAMCSMILLFVRLLRLHAAIRPLFRWIVPACVIQNRPVVGPSGSQLVMEHELFRHVELELFVQRSQLDAAMRFVTHALMIAGDNQTETDTTFRAQVIDAGCEQQLQEIRGKYIHHFPVCIRRIMPDETLISMASNAAIEVANDNSPPDEAWYSITLTNYQRGAAREPFYELARFLTISMAHHFDARPHWGKLCPLPAADAVQLYPGFERFKRICDAMDPERNFANPWTKELLDAARPSQLVGQQITEQ